MDFNVFDTTKMDEYARQAKEQWGQTAEYKEYEKRIMDSSHNIQKVEWQNLMLIFVEYGTTLIIIKVEIAVGIVLVV